MSHPVGSSGDLDERPLRAEGSGPTTTGAADGNPHEYNFSRALAVARRVAKRTLSRARPEDIEDLGQEAALRVHGLIRTGRIVQNLEALVTDVTRKLAIDQIRRERRWGALMVGENEASRHVAARPEPPLGDPVERLRFIVLAYFERSSPECFSQACAYFDEVPWSEFAASVRKKPDAVRKSWERCVNRLRDALRTTPGFAPLAEWAASPWGG